ncbi:cation transporter [Streptococcus sp. HMSC34B10]|uniref:cation diffusion facilitator family transporter n=1 Tax=Streptococcus TaxID=1301 RepID=UPI0008A9C059|nr:cation diffusion facilitator family transporter [Streptococcus sp. HMSC34B10]OHS88328.1 cation transporter [Streptococcus sp. HMSC34B10]
MTSKGAVWLVFLLNSVFAMIEFISGGIFHSSAVLADAVHDTGDALAIGLSALLESISNREEDSRYTLGYKRFSLLGALVTAVILMTGSMMVLLENISKLFHPQVVNSQGMFWIGVIAIVINVIASLIVEKGKTKNESILSLHFLEDTLGWLAVILMAIILRFTDWYILDPLLSLAISLFILSKAIPRFWSTLKIFLDAVPEGVDIQKIKSDLEQLDHVASVNQLNLWTMDGLEKNAIIHVCLEHVKHMEVCKESIRDLLKDCGFQNVTIEVDEDLATHRAHKRNMAELEANRNHGHDHS